MWVIGRDGAIDTMGEATFSWGYALHGGYGSIDFDVISKEEADRRQLVGQVIDEDGPMIEPWRIPLMASVVWERAPLTCTWTVRRLRKDSTRFITVGAMPYLPSLAGRNRWLTKSRAFEKLK